MKYMVDIDGTICTNTHGDYKSAQPLVERIEKLNALYDAGHEIHYWTARGATTGIDWSILMLNQLREWGVKYTSANLGKPVYDIWIDDKALSDKEFFA